MSEPDWDPRPAFPVLDLRGRVTRGGRALVFARAEVRAGDGRLYATADGTFAVLDPSRVVAR